MKLLSVNRQGAGCALEINFPQMPNFSTVARYYYESVSEAFGTACSRVPSRTVYAVGKRLATLRVAQSVGLSQASMPPEEAA